MEHHKIRSLTTT